MKMARLSFRAFVLFVVIAFASFGFAATFCVRTVTIGVEGMTCKMCAVPIETDLKATKGVIDARVSLKKENVWIKYDDEKVTIAKLRQVINNTGFKAR